HALLVSARASIPRRDIGFLVHRRGDAAGTIIERLDDVLESGRRVVQLSGRNPETEPSSRRNFLADPFGNRIGVSPVVDVGNRSHRPANARLLPLRPAIPPSAGTIDLCEAASDLGAMRREPMRLGPLVHHVFKTLGGGGPPVTG